METPTDRSQTPQGETGSPRWTERVVHRTAPPGTLPCLEAEVMLLGDAHGSTDPADITCPQCKGPTRSPHAAGEPAICDPGRHVSGPWCSRCGQWFVDGIWRNTPPETERSPRRRTVNVTDLDGDLITALGDLTDTYGVAGVRKTMGILWPIEPVKLAAGGFVNGPRPVLVGEKDGPWLSLADHLELARGKTPQAEIEATADTPIDPADIHSDDAMLSAVASEGITPLTPVAEEIRVVLNRYSAEAPSGTPDYILANYLIDCLKAFNEAVSLRAVWRGEPIEQMVLHIDKER